MNKYELALVVSAKLDSEAIAATVQRAKDYIERFGGTIGEVEEWGKRKLAYEIQKQTEAYYFFINFDAEPQVPAQLESVLRIMDNVLRYLVLAKDENDTFKVAPEKAPAAEEALEAPAAEEEVPAEEEPAAEEEAAE
jgi:small subunit ribosomal protein S6